MVPVGPERWQRQRLGERGDRQPPVHTSTPRNDWGVRCGLLEEEWALESPRGWGALGLCVTACVRLVEQDAGPRFPTSSPCWLSGPAALFSLPMPSTACSACPSLFQLQGPRDRIDVTSHCPSDGAHSPRASHVTCEPGAGIPGAGPVAPPKVPVRGTRRRLSTCSRKGGSADRLRGLTSPALDSGFSLALMCKSLCRPTPPQDRWKACWF